MASDRRQRADSQPVLDEYTRLAPHYDRKWSRYVQASARETLARMDLAPGDRVLDLGCGTGVLLARVAGAWPDARLLGMDPVAGMLEVARGRLPHRVALVRGWADALPLADASLDVVLSCSMFHYLTEADRALTEIHRVLRPGGRFVLTDWCDDYLACRVCDLLLRWFDPAHVRTWGLDECARRLEDSGFRLTRAERYRIDWLWGLMTLCAVKPDPPAGDRDRLSQSVPPPPAEAGA